MFYEPKKKKHYNKAEPKEGPWSRVQRAFS